MPFKCEQHIENHIFEEFYSNKWKAMDFMDGTILIAMHEANVKLVMSSLHTLGKNSLNDFHIKAGIVQ